MLNKKTLKDLNLDGKKVLVRVDFNVPMSSEGEITDDTRIKASLETIKYLVDHNAKVILMSHLGRPKNGPEKKFSLEPVAKKLSELIGKDIKFLYSDKVVDENVKKKWSELQNGEIALLENTRFRSEETKNGEEFSKELASLADLYVNDAFGTSHRAHSSNVGVSKYLESAIGFLVEKEIEVMGNALENPKRPFIAILGGAKVSDKIGVIDNLINKVDGILVGGGMAWTFLKAEGYEVGKSLVENDKLDLAKQLLQKAMEKGVKFFLPIDAIVADEMTEDSPSKVISIKEFTPEDSAFDIGPRTIDVFVEEIEKSKTIVWNGPMGVFEIEQFSKGTFDIAKALSKVDAITIIGGGDSASAIEKSGYKDSVTHVSTGGGASLEFLEGKELPGIAAISDK
ncbi:phosphoglycerate kinase [Lagierella sp.]|uniref:phosphoglycerate kinase n=1 Tax=Lagierella sp. TaxID=2849657 RepID=UPI0026122A0D|nr:phosphoglycerate kinase [Lagierella sp.]